MKFLVFIFIARVSYTEEATHAYRGTKATAIRKSWIPKILNPYFDKLDRIDRMTGPRRLYRVVPLSTSKRDRKKEQNEL